MIKPDTRRVLLVALLGLLSGAGPAATAARSQDVLSEPTQAQPELQKQPLTVVSRGGARHLFSVELARTPREQQVGLMFRTHIDDDGGMLFIWPYPQQSEMWMENCPIPEDMLFVAEDGTIRSIAENTVPESLAHVSSAGVVKATIELQGGLTAKLGISVGDRIENKAFEQSREAMR